MIYMSFTSTLLLIYLLHVLFWFWCIPIVAVCNVSFEGNTFKIWPQFLFHKIKAQKICLEVCDLVGCWRLLDVKEKFTSLYVVHR
jgi:hypothetical protein